MLRFLAGAGGLGTIMILVMGLTTASPAPACGATAGANCPCCQDPGFECCTCTLIDCSQGSGSCSCTWWCVPKPPIQ